MVKTPTGSTNFYIKGNFIEHLAGFSSNGKKGLKIILDDKNFDNDKGINIKQA